jgi:hypothetical protein
MADEGTTNDKTGAEPKTSRAKKGLKPGQRPASRPAGWGGPAKGAGKKTPAFVFTDPGPGRGKFTAEGEKRKEAQHRRVETLLAFLWEVTTGKTIDGSHTVPTRVQAAKHLLDRIQGMPVQMVASITTDDLSMMTDDELAADVKRRSGKVRAFIEASMDEDLPQEPERLGD